MVPVSAAKAGRGGALSIEFQCHGCLARIVRFESFLLYGSSKKILNSIAMQVASIISGSTYRQYQRLFGMGLGMEAVTSKTFGCTIELMFPHVQKMLDNMCSRALEEMKRQPAHEIGSAGRAVTTSDGAWMTRGAHSKNFSFVIRDFMTGGLPFRPPSVSLRQGHWVPHPFVSRDFEVSRGPCCLAGG